MRTVLIEIEVPEEGYEDVCDELVLVDFVDNPGAWSVRLAALDGEKGKGA